MKKLFHITAGQAEIKGEQQLALCVGEKHIGFAITNLTGNHLYQLTYYSFDSTDEKSVNDILAAHPELNEVYKKVFISYSYSQNLLVPFHFYKKEEAETSLRSLYGINGKTVIAEELLSEWQLYTIYSIPKDVDERLHIKFPGSTFTHQYSVSIKNINNADEQGKFWIDFRENDFTVIAAKQNKLLLAQTFAYSTPNDVVYYLLKIGEQFSFSQQEVMLVLSGLIEKRSSLFNELYQYFLNVEFKEADWSFNGTNEYPSHFFTSLNDLATCAS